MSTNSTELFERAQQVMPGGVNSPVRAFRSVGGSPVFIESAQGCWLTDVDGRRYLDLFGSWGPMILGHGHPEVVEAIRAQAQRGISFGAPCEAEVKLAELVCEMVPAAEMVRMVNSGTEACMSAIRLARAFTGREYIIKFAGGYHGHGDAFLSQAGSGSATLGIPASPGVPTAVAAQTLDARYNDLGSVRALLNTHAGRVAGIIVEPVSGNMGCVPPERGFLEGLRELCEPGGPLLIFDEVMTGFRLSPGGAMEKFGVMPDLVCLGKVLGGGLPVGAYAGRREIMSRVAPSGTMYQAGTLSGNPLGMAAGLATLRILKRDPAICDRLEARGRFLAESARETATRHSLPVTVNQFGSMLTVFFSAEPVRDFDGAKKCDTKAFARFFHGMLSRGVHLPASQFEAFFLSDALDDAPLAEAAKAMADALREAFAPQQ